MKIEKGKKYRCVDTDGILFTHGKVYECLEDGELINDNGWVVNSFQSKFQLVEEPTTEELLKRIEALERLLMPESTCTITKIHNDGSREVVSTSAKFKAIADHANAINDIIKNAQE